MWTLHVEDFGRIENADIEVSPLTLFVGDNNSGKSYLLALLYGLMCADDVLSDLCESSPEYQACAEWAERELGQKSAENARRRALFDDYACSIFENLWNRILEDRKERILLSIFNGEIPAGKIRISFSFKSPVSIYIQCADNDIKRVRLLGRQFLYGNFNVGRIVLFIMKTLITGAFGRNVVFLPTARTGFLLTYPALARDAFSRAYNRDENRNFSFSFTRPCSDFLGSLAALNEQKRPLLRTKFGAPSNPYEPVIRFAESNILHGKISVSHDLPLPVFNYRPEMTTTDVPMFLSSDVVKEVAPLILTLQYQMPYGGGVLFIEEPEMSLHPKLQQAMARTLIKISNMRLTFVLAATHSDTILQHVNNMIKLNNLPEARRQTLIKRFQFDPDDPISADMISMYQFDVQGNGKTVVQALKCGPYGFEIPTFYDPLEKLLEQTRATEPDAEEYED